MSKIDGLEDLVNRVGNSVFENEDGMYEVKFAWYKRITGVTKEDVINGYLNYLYLINENVEKAIAPPDIGEGAD